MSDEKNMEEKKLEVVSGDVKNLNISKVYDHLNIAKPTSVKDSDKPKDKKVVIPHLKNFDVKKKKKS